METTFILDFENKITGTYQMYCNQVIKDKSIYATEIAGSRYENMTFENVEFNNCTFQSTEFINVKFIDCKFTNCNFSFSKLIDCNLIACKIENCSFCITNSLNCNFLSCTYIENTWENSKLAGNFLDCIIGENDLSAMKTFMATEASTLFSSLTPELLVA